MEPPISRESRPGIPRTGSLLVATALIVAGALWLFLTWRGSSKDHIHGVELGSPYENTRPGVKYVGDAACARCHAGIADTYRRHPMGQSLALITDAAAPRAMPGKGRSRFEAKGLEYSVEYQDNHVIHKETRRDRSGRLVAQAEAEVQYAIGSGRQGISYLIERDGYLFQSPITWYSKDQRLGLSPNYEKTNYHFDRPILSECLFCHANAAERVSSAINRYKTPIFRGHAIGCERCHGPGDFHVRRPTVVDGRDTTIVNPANLEPSRRDAVCEQCHLIGPRRIVRVDSRSEDFRPGLEFYQFWSVFVPSAGSPPNKFAGQVEQMHDSRCFRSSEGRLGCISCHDPHVLPLPEEKAAYFRARCFGCHSEQDCHFPAIAKVERKDASNCIGCHMPRSDSSNNPHVATTNHRIPRHADDLPESPVISQRAVRGPPSLVNFHHELMGSENLASSERDRAIALCRTGGDPAAREALPLFEAAIAARPDDVAALESYGEILGRLGRLEEGLAAYKKCLARDPTRQTALEGAAQLASRAGWYKEAVELWKRAVAINPWRSDYHAGLARAALQVRDWTVAAEASRSALRLSPSLLDVRKWLVQCNLHLGNRDAARNELEILLGFDPPDRDALLRRFRSLATPR